MTGMEAPAILAAVSTGMGAVNTVAGMQQASSQRSAQAAQVAQQQERAHLERRIEERRLERERRKQESSARARLGASGVGSTGGSGAAVLRGLNADFDQQLSDSRALFNNSMQNSTNLLDDGPGLSGALKVGQQLTNLGGQVVGLLEK